ncbi:MAG: sensor histidine kinase [Phycisphaerales bacterium]|nr:sensor histidine kinase [Phycisphaerales bacterium]
MNRPGLTLGILGTCAVVLVGLVAWQSVLVLRFEKAVGRARNEAQFEEHVRLALWRLDSLVVPLLAQENARPPADYVPLVREQVTTADHEGAPVEVLRPSPLLGLASRYIRLHFELDANDALRSPQVPAGTARALAESNYAPQKTISSAGADLDDLRPRVTYAALSAQLPDEAAPLLALQNPVQQQQEITGQTAGPQQVVAQNFEAQRAAGVREQAARDRTVYNILQSDLGNTFVNRSTAGNPDGAVLTVPLTAVWLDNELLLVRRVQFPGGPVLQGCWLRWPALADTLRDEIADLFPAASLVPAPRTTTATGQSSGRRFATLPVLLEPGPLAVALPPAPSSTGLMLVAVWSGIVVALLAVGGLVVGVVQLSERRAAFVSAVTHELRTPLTTFQLYTELLAGGLIPDEQRRREYLETLRAEAGRLSHLVENVLAYARLERGRTARTQETIDIATLLERMRPRLVERAGLAGLTVELCLPTGVEHAAVCVDPLAVEQILFNLVDNACKYASAGPARRVHVESSADEQHVRLAVRDHGPGVPRAERNRLFRPFHKSASAAAEAKPGVGLGLALSRRLARRLGGELRLVTDHAHEGACFELELPRRRSK